MPKVQIRDAANHDKVILPTVDLAFEPHLNKPVWIRGRVQDTNSKGYIITGVLQYEIVVNAPEESGMVLLARPID